MILFIKKTQKWNGSLICYWNKPSSFIFEFNPLQFSDFSDIQMINISGSNICFTANSSIGNFPRIDSNRKCFAFSVSVGLSALIVIDWINNNKFRNTHFQPFIGYGFVPGEQSWKCVLRNQLLSIAVISENYLFMEKF